MTDGGVVTGIAVGKATISVTMESMGRTARAEVTVTAPETFTVLFESNDGSAVAAQTVESGKTATKPEDPSRAGYTFDGWYSNKELTKLYDFLTPVTSNLTLYAKFTEAANEDDSKTSDDSKKSEDSKTDDSKSEDGKKSDDGKSDNGKSDDSKKSEDGKSDDSKSTDDSKSDDGKKSDDSKKPSNPSADDVLVLHRVYNPNSGEHVYTPDVNEIKGLTDLGWKDEGVAWTAPGASTPGVKAVHRLLNPNSQDHHLTVSEQEIASLVAAGWRDEGTAFYSGGSTPVYVEFNPNATIGSHNYTPNKAEHDNLLSIGWQGTNEAAFMAVRVE